MQPPPLTNHVTHHRIDMPNVMITIDADYHHLDPLTPGEYHGTTPDGRLGRARPSGGGATHLR